MTPLPLEPRPPRRCYRHEREGRAKPCAPGECELLRDFPGQDFGERLCDLDEPTDRGHVHVA